MPKDKFGTAINCIDGRVQLPVIKWLKENYHLDYIDMITEPGPEKVLSHGEEIESLKSKVLISVKAHGSDIIAIVGHYDCAGNPVSKEEQFNQIQRAVQVIHSWNLEAIQKVIGLWVNDSWKIEVVDISEEEEIGIRPRKQN